MSILLVEYCFNNLTFKWPCQQACALASTINARYGDEKTFHGVFFMRLYLALIAGSILLIISARVFSMDTSHTLFEYIGFDDNEYVDLLEKLMIHVRHVQNNPGEGLIPEERLIADEVVRYLGNYAGLSIQSHSYDGKGNRPNLIIRYKHPDAITEGKTIAFMGSHMDVVPANANEWKHDPFLLTKESLNDDIKLHGRGTTDCLGHVALLSVMMKRLAHKQIRLNREIVVVFIADEEVGQAQVGVFKLHEHGLLNDFKKGPIYWVDTASDDGLFGPRVGTAGVGKWSIIVTGRSGHSGYPHLCINPITIATALMTYMDERFAKDFQGDAKKQYAKAHLYPECSSCKRTHIQSISPAKNTIPSQCILGGDVRFTPDFDAKFVRKALPTYVKDFNVGLQRGEITLSSAPGGTSFTHDDYKKKISPEITFTWDSEEFNMPFAADLNSLAYKNILQAMEDVRQRAQPFSALGSLPLIFELSDAGYKLVPIGFGRQKAYHAPDEYCMLSEMRDGFKVMVRAIELFQQ